MSASPSPDDQLAGAAQDASGAESFCAPAISAAPLNITVAYAPAPREVVEVALQLPPGATLAQAVQASGLGTVYSFVVMHYPEVPPFDYPNPVGLIELDEGTRLVAQLVGVKSGEVQIGQRVQVEFNTFNDGEMVLPQFRPIAA